MADAFATQLATELRIDARRVFVAAVRKFAEDFRTGPAGSVKLGNAGGGRVPRDTGRLQTSMKVSNMSLVTDLLVADVTVTAKNRGADYPAILDAGGRVGGRTRRAVAKSGGSSGRAWTDWWATWLGENGGDDRWLRSLAAEFDRIGG